MYTDTAQSIIIVIGAFVVMGLSKFSLFFFPFSKPATFCNGILRRLFKRDLKDAALGT